jgi:hypothetical protein
MEVMAAPRWSVITRTVMPVLGLLTATNPSMPPDRIMPPVQKQYKPLFSFSLTVRTNGNNWYNNLVKQVYDAGLSGHKLSRGSEAYAP